MLVALFLMMFSSGAGDFLVVDISKPVEQFVVDTVKAKQIIVINQAMLNDEAEFNKDYMAFKGQLVKINAKRLAIESEFEGVFATIDAKRTAAREKILDHRFKMKALMTADEWHKVHAKTHQVD